MSFKPVNIYSTRHFVTCDIFDMPFSKPIANWVQLSVWSYPQCTWGNYQIVIVTYIYILYSSYAGIIRAASSYIFLFFFRKKFLFFLFLCFLVIDTFFQCIHVLMDHILRFLFQLFYVSFLFFKCGDSKCWRVSSTKLAQLRSSRWLVVMPEDLKGVKLAPWQ